MNAALLIWNPHNRALIAEALAGECTVLPAQADVFSEDVDLLVVEGPALAMSRAQIADMKRRAEPLFLPVLFISQRPDIASTAPDLWRITDDVVSRPIVRRELVARVRTLLNARSLSLRLQQTRIMYRRAHEIAETLQRAALPNALPQVPGFRLDAYYEPSKMEAHVGGDWYDALCVNDGRIVLSIGDVAGAGLQAAVTMASVRQAIRAVAQIYPDPLTMIDAADRMLKDEQPGRIVTAFVGVLDPVTLTITYASAGHPPPLLRRNDGEIVELKAQSLPLGLRVRGDGISAICDLPPGSFLTLFTDGLSEVTRDVFEGEARLRRALCDPRLAQSQNPAAFLKNAVYAGDTHADDVAVMVLHVLEPQENAVYRWHLQAVDERSASNARREFVERLQECGVSRDGLFTCELIFGELLGNVVRYAPGPLEIVLDVRLPRPVLHFLDSGKGFTLVPRLPSDLLSERGRGLFLIWTLSDDFNVNVRPTGGSHARAALPVRIATAPAAAFTPPYSSRAVFTAPETCARPPL